MRKCAALVLFPLLLASLLAPPVGSALAQSRPRRVVTPPAGTQPPASTPKPPASAPQTRPTPLPQGSPGASQPGQPGQPGARTAPARGEVNEEVGEDEVLRVNAALVTVPVTVLDRDGRFISGLRREEFRILEDGIEQEITYFAPVEQPFTVALLIDTSNSTRFKLDEIQSAAIAFLDQLRPEDRVMVISFDDAVKVLSEPTSDRAELRRAVRRTQTGGSTRLYDAVDTAIRRLDHVKGRKAMVLFTDGVDTTSRAASYPSTIVQAEELDALVYPIQYNTYRDVGGGQGPSGGGVGMVIDILRGKIPAPTGGGGGPGSSREEYRRAGEYLRRLANLTGGRHHDADDIYNLERAFTSIAEELRRQYSLGYYPARQSQASERRQIRVRVRRPNLVVRSRDSYVYKPAGSPRTNFARGDRTPDAPPELRRRDFVTADPRRRVR
ncbi:MAG TPA: VWA domain-containing protein [Pyrinomonadaceae bacterium]|nr:VWA domain-containing protein [Pyrinomonadaceae bacterium]